MATSPPVHAFDDYRTYVVAWLDHRPRLSQRWFAQRVDASPSLVSMVLSGKRPGQLRDAEVWGQALGLEPDEQAHFAATIAQAHAPTELMRQDAALRVRAGLDFHRADPLADGVTWLGSWLHLALLEAARSPDFDGDPEALAERIWPAVSVEEVESAIADLIASGTLTANVNGWRTDMRPLRTAMRIRGSETAEQATELHRDQLLHALRALDEQTADQRHIASVTLAVSRDRVSDFLASAQRLPLDIAAGHAEDAPEEVMELVVAAFCRSSSPR